MEKLKKVHKSEQHGWQKEKVALQHEHQAALTTRSPNDDTEIKQEIATMFNLQDELEDRMSTMDLLRWGNSQLQAERATKRANR